MGFSSMLCTCGEPILGHHAVTDGRGPEWMSKVVAHYPNHDMRIGTYNGYGEILDPATICPDDEPGPPPSGHRLLWTANMRHTQADVRHQACWMEAGCPEFERKSPVCPKQGWWGDWNRCKPAAPLDAQQRAEEAHMRRVYRRQARAEG